MKTNLIFLPLALLTFASPALAMEANNNNLNGSQEEQRKKSSEPMSWHEEQLLKTIKSAVQKSQTLSEVTDLIRALAGENGRFATLITPVNKKRNPFGDLPIDIQNDILQMIWEDDDHKQFKNDIATKFNKEFKESYTKNIKDENSAFKLVPINLYSPQTMRIINYVGSITTSDKGLEKERMTGFYHPSELKRELILPGCGILIKEEANDTRILGAAVSIHGLIAIHWWNQSKKHFISFVNFGDIKNSSDSVIDLEESKVPIKCSDSCMPILFNRAGDKLALIDLDPKETGVDFVDVPNQLLNKKLTPVQMAKHLMLPTTELKKELEQKRLSHNN